jgi:RimJ/RimL family protein N-acetyltransferase
MERPLAITDLSAGLAPLLREHFARLRVDSGRDGLHFMPFAPGAPDGPKGPDPLKFALPVSEPGWVRCFVVWNEDRTHIIGHVDLAGGRLATETHRCVLGIGIEAPWCGRGLGKRLMRAAIEFAEEQATLDWIELYVFGNNTRARRLYQSVGFVEVGVVPDRFRIGSDVIDDVIMVFKLRA